MAQEVAGLSLGVDVEQVTKAIKSLNDFGKATDKAADSVDDFINHAEVAKIKSREMAKELQEGKRQFAAIAESVDPTVKQLGKLKKAANDLDNLWSKGMIPSDDFFRLGAVIDNQTHKLLESRQALTAEGKAAIEEARSKEQASKAAQKFIADLQRQSEYAGLTAREMMEVKAAQLGVSAQAAPFIAKMNAQNQGMKMAGLSAGQYSQALRILPMQITDVVTSLASGMPVWLVAIQQGGQIKDSFGGVGNTFKVLLSYLTPTRIALAATVGVMVALGKAAYDSYESNKRLSDALILTGNYAGRTTGQIKAMAAVIAESTNSTVGAVLDIATSLVKTGKYTGEQIKQITATTAQWAQVTGDSADKITDYFDKIAKDPVQGLKELNDTFNFLDKGQLTYISSLEKTKGKTEAVTAATKIFSDEMENRLSKIADSATPLEKMWDNVKRWSSEAWKSVGDHTRGALNLITDVVAGTVEQIQFILNQGDAIIGEFVISAIQQMQKIPAMGEFGNDVLAQQQKVVDEAKRQNKELAKSIEERDARIRKGEMGYITDQDNEKSPNGQTSKNKEAIDKEAEALKKKNKEQKVSVEQGDKISEQHQADILALQAQLMVLKEHTSVNDSISQQRKTLWNDQAKFKILEEAATTRTLTKEEKSLLANKDKILALSDQKAELGDQIVAQTQLNKLQDESFKFVTKMTAATQSMNQTSGLGDLAAKRQQELSDMKASFVSKGGQEDDPALQRMVEAREKFYAEEDSKRNDWLAGMQSAVATYGENVTNMYDNIGQVATSAMDGMAGLMTDFLMTGQANFGDFAKSIIGMIIKMIAQMVIFNAISGMMGGGGGFSFSGASAASAPAAAAAFSPVNDGIATVAGGATMAVASRAVSNQSAMSGASGGRAMGSVVVGGGGSSFNISDIDVNVNNGNDPKGTEQGVRAIFQEMIQRSVSQGGEIYNYVQSKG